MKYDLSRFSPGSFQRFAQALALHIFGPGLEVYGSGPDGGRDATFDGKPNFPSSTKPWDGYTVVQVKYREKPKGDHRDSDWLVDQIKLEQEAFRKSQRASRKPQYYLIITNVALSGVPRSGGLAKARAALANLKKQLKLKDYDVWGYDKLCTLLDNGPESIKKQYSAWITPSDLIWAILQERRGPDFSNIIARFAAQDLKEHKFTRLQEAGHSDAESTLLSDVFVDLPIEFGPSLGSRRIRQRELFDATNSIGNAKDKKELATASLVSYALENFSNVFAKARDADKVSEYDRAGSNGRIVLLGGPGQGKSTLGQFLVQLFQAKLLNAPNAPELGAETINYARKLLTCASDGGIDLAFPYRIPFRISLPRFADEIVECRKKGERCSFLDYVAREISRQANETITTNNLREWLPDYAWIFVLDGLDEVPPSGERPSVLREIEALFDEIASGHSDALVVVTTRPQGYHRDLDPALWWHWELTPLPPEAALRYADKLAHIRLTEPGRRERILQRLQEAMGSSATAQLMISPLQIAILFTLVDLKGDVPTDRWNLFDRYFVVLRDREEGKGGESGELLRQHRAAVEVIHQYTGFLLHVEAERSGGAESYLTKSQFEELVSSFLGNQGFEGATLNKLTQGLVTLATDRLVLLRTRTEDRISFDVRSLQEFMAAANSTAAKDIDVEARLRIIAARSHWRHVFQIAASRCFADTGKHHLIDLIIRLCAELDTGLDDESDRVAKSGARLAIDLLVDGLASESPKHRKLLFERALGSLDLGPGLFDRRLATVVDDNLRQYCIDFLRMKIRAIGSRPSLAAWKLLLELTRQKVEWAQGLAKELWPSNPEDALAIADEEDRDDFKNVIKEFALDSVINAGYPQVLKKRNFIYFIESAFSIDFYGGHGKSTNSAFKAAISIPGKAASMVCQVSSMTNHANYDGFLRANVDIKKWAPFIVAGTFLRAPSRTSAADGLELILQNTDLSAAAHAAYFLPWPLAAFLELVAGGTPVSEVSAQIRSGQFGNTDDWKTAEMRWQEKGISFDDLKFSAENGLLFDRNVRNIGIPPWRWARPEGQNAYEALEQMINLFNIGQADLFKIRIAFAIASIMHTPSLNPTVIKSLMPVLRWLKSHRENWSTLSLCRRLIWQVRHFDADGFTTLEEVGTTISPKDLNSLIQPKFYEHEYRHRHETESVDEILSAVSRHGKRGLLTFVLLLLTQIDRRTVSVASLAGSLYTIEENDPDIVKMAIIGTKILTRALGVEDAATYLNYLVTIADQAGDNDDLVPYLVDLWTREHRLEPETPEILSEIVSCRVGQQQAEVYTRILRTSLDQRHSSLSDQHCWHQLGLPMNLFGMLAKISADRIETPRPVRR